MSFERGLIRSMTESIKAVPSATVKSTKEVTAIFGGSSKTFMESTKVDSQRIQSPQATIRNSRVAASRPKGRY